MTEEFKNDDVAASQHNESDVLVLIKKMHQQLTFLEKKIDMLISQSKERPFREKQFSKPFRSFDRSNRQGRYQEKRDQGEDSGERSFSSGNYSEKRRREEPRGFGGPKKEYSADRENSSGQDRYFKKKFDDKKRGFGPKKKKFFEKRRD